MFTIQSILCEIRFQIPQTLAFELPHIMPKGVTSQQSIIIGHQVHNIRPSWKKIYPFHLLSTQITPSNPHTHKVQIPENQIALHLNYHLSFHLNRSTSPPSAQ